MRSGLIGMLGTFIDTLIICSLTGLAIITWASGPAAPAAPGAVLGGVRGGDAGRRPPHPVVGPGGVRLYHHPRLELHGERRWENWWARARSCRSGSSRPSAIPFGAMTQLTSFWLVADALDR
ncbi:alanine:cation symporter family protein [Pseudomonas aeruginosa]